MGEKTKIEWADNTFNPWIGCTKVSAGCANCYAEHTTRARVLRAQGHETWGKGAQRSRTSKATWANPLRWNSEVEPHPNYRTKVFPSLCDWLDDEVPIEWLADFLKLIHDTPHLDWLLLTKRPENFERRLRACAVSIPGYQGNTALFWWMRDPSRPPHNIWLGVSVEDQKAADARIPILLRIPAAIRFLSVEPLLGPVNLRTICTMVAGPLNALERGAGLHWVIVGGESGPGARPCNLGWVRDIVQDCSNSEARCFVKQIGSRPFYPPRFEGDNTFLKLKDKKGGHPDEWPADLRVRQFPE